MLKRFLRRYVGEQAWGKLTEFKQEFKIRNQEVHMDPDLYEFFKTRLPDKGYFVDVGAHDGRSYSNTFHLEKLGWKGILIEPILPTYFRLKQIRNPHTNHFVNSACVSFDYPDSNLEMSYGDLMSIAPSISRLNSEEWVAGSTTFLNRNEDNAVTWVPAKTLNSIMQELQSPEHLEFLSIDVEGAELEVLKGIDFLNYEIDIICVETYEPNLIREWMELKPYREIGFLAHNLIFERNQD
jgi:FkbM family methyltransferase